MLIFTALLTAIGSLGNAFSYHLPTFALFRFITGMGVGVGLSLRFREFVFDLSPSSPLFPSPCRLRER